MNIEETQMRKRVGDLDPHGITGSHNSHDDNVMRLPSEEKEHVRTDFTCSRPRTHTNEVASHGTFRLEVVVLEFLVFKSFVGVSILRSKPQW